MQQHEFVYPKVTPASRVVPPEPEPTAGRPASPSGQRALVKASLLMCPPKRKRP
jgi:hypothetical protein